MPNPREWMEFFYPYIFDGCDTRFAAEQDLEMALAVAADYRPACLSEDRKNQAQAHYAAYVIEYRDRMKAVNATNSNVTATVAGPIIEKSEGDVSVKYATSASQTSASQVRSQLTGPGTAFAAWQALYDVCITGEGTPPPGGDGQLPVRRGAIITSYG